MGGVIEVGFVRVSVHCSGLGGAGSLLGKQGKIDAFGGVSRSARSAVRAVVPVFA